MEHGHSTGSLASTNEEGSDVAHLVVDTTLYTSDALFRACYAFTDRCYLFLKQQSAHEIEIEFRRSHSSVAVPDVVGAFANELISQRVRGDMVRATRAVGERIVAKAFAEAE